MAHVQIHNAQEQLSLAPLSNRGTLIDAARFVPALLLIVDFGVIVCTALLAAEFHYGLFLQFDFERMPILGAAILGGMLFVAIAHARGSYDGSRFMRADFQVGSMLGTWCLTQLLVTFILFLLHVGDSYSRGTIVLWAMLAPVFFVGIRFPLRKLVQARFKAQSRYVQIEVWPDDTAGGKRNAGETQSAVNRCYVSGTFEAGGVLCGNDRRQLINALETARVLKADRLILAMPLENRGLLEAMLEVLQATPLPVYLVPDGKMQSLLQCPRISYGHEVALEIKRAPLSRRDLLVKRIFDVSVASLMLLMLLPVFILVAIAIKLDSRGPVLFRQSRRGFGGQTFDIAKFRTMSVQENGATVVQATKNDSRVTRVGRRLRSSSIDELPQLLNVLWGDMSLVGPRPHAVAHDDYYGRQIDEYALRYHVKPGITGWAQVNGFRGETQSIDLMERRVEHDLHYIQHWSFWWDIRIMLKTVWSVLRTETAY
jgi:Undecaprenyl-phosphate glucose phosphotransferase